ncbi:hypothetical protein [Kineosporia succinea]|uniref:PGAP1-like protein n=1 Tax=Kineosporia succinea TaxID=84632 RepID=A0ABT9PCN5_9ACTN|nr:hypothetical protein [Kineosporia succinea]MDP9830159.1 hypothetical protein [Kineosporia succinea]
MADPELDEVPEPILDLARLVSVATIVEPALLRRVRLRLLPKLDAGAESELWFGPLVASASTSGITLRPEVSEQLRAQLTDHPQAPAARSIVLDLHQEHSALIRLEEKVIWAAITGDTRAVGDAMATVLASVTGPDGPDLLRWFRQAARRLPARALATDAAQETLRLATIVLERRIPPGLIGSRTFGLGAATFSAAASQLSLKISMDDAGLTFDSPSPSDPMEQRIELPDTDPPVLEVRWGDASQVVEASPGTSVALPRLGREVRLRTLAGRRYVVSVDAGRQPRHRPRQVISITLKNVALQAMAAVESAELESWLATPGVLGTRAFRTFSRNTANDVSELLTFLSDASRAWTSADAVVIHLAVSTRQGTHGPVLLDAQGRPGIQLADLIQLLRESRVGRLLLLLDTERAGTVLRDPSVLGLPPGWIVVTATGAVRESPNRQGFISPLRRQLEQYDPAKPYFSVRDLNDALERSLGHDEWDVHAVGDLLAPHPCLPNPSHGPLPPRQGLLEHWAPGDRTSEQPWRVIARSRIIQDLLREPPVADLILLTGSAWSGKSVLIDYLVAFGDREFADQHRASLREIPRSLRPPIGWADIAVYANGLDSDGVLHRIGQALGLESGHDDPGAIEVALAQRGHATGKTRIVVDALDDMLTHGFQETVETLALLSRVPGTHVVAVSRSSHPAASRLQRLGAVVLDVDEQVESDTVTVAYLTDLLTASETSPYLDDLPLARRLVRAVLAVTRADLARARGLVLFLADYARVVDPADQDFLIGLDAGYIDHQPVGDDPRHHDEVGSGISEVPEQLVAFTTSGPTPGLNPAERSRAGQDLRGWLLAASSETGLPPAKRETLLLDDWYVAIWPQHVMAPGLILSWARNYARKLRQQPEGSVLPPGRLAITMGEVWENRTDARLGGPAFSRARRLADSPQARLISQLSSSASLVLLIDENVHARLGNLERDAFVRYFVTARNGLRLPAWGTVPGGTEADIKALREALPPITILPGADHDQTGAAVLRADLEQATADGLVRAGASNRPPRIRLVTYDRLQRSKDQRRNSLTTTTLDQVGWYLSDSLIKRETDAHLAQSLSYGPEILIGHGLGSVLALEYLRQHPHRHIGLLLTTGSILGHPLVREKLPEPTFGIAEGIPPNVGRWVNVRDPADPVTSGGSDLRSIWFGIDEFTVDNGNSHHAVNRYLSSRVVGETLTRYLP